MEQNPYQSPQGPSGEIPPANSGNVLKSAGRVMILTGVLIIPVSEYLNHRNDDRVFFNSVAAALILVGLYFFGIGNNRSKRSSG